MNAADAQEVRALLVNLNDGYRQLAQQHHDLDHRLHQLSDTPHPSDSELLEEAVLKKRKLALKDQMEQVAREFLASRAMST